MPEDRYGKKNWKGTLISVAAIAVSLVVVGGCLLGGYIGYKNYTQNHKKKKDTTVQQETRLTEQTKQVQQTQKETVVSATVQMTEPTTVQTTTSTQPQTTAQTIAPTTAVQTTVPTTAVQTTAQTQPAQPVTAVLGQLAASNAYGGGLVQYTSFYDNMGSYYASGWGGGASEMDNGCDFSLNYNYQTFSGTVVLNGEFASSAKYSYADRNHYDYVRLRIYGDGILLYTSPVVVWGMEPDSFNVDVSNVNTLRLEINGKNFIRLVNDCLIQK